MKFGCQEPSKNFLTFESFVRQKLNLSAIASMIVMVTINNHDDDDDGGGGDVDGDK